MDVGVGERESGERENVPVRVHVHVQVFVDRVPDARVSEAERGLRDGLSVAERGLSVGEQVALGVEVEVEVEVQLGVPLKVPNPLGEMECEPEWLFDTESVGMLAVWLPEKEEDGEGLEVRLELTGDIVPENVSVKLAVWLKERDGGVQVLGEVTDPL